MAKKNIFILTLGGTIAMAGDGRAGVVPVLDGDELLRSVPGLDVVANVKVESILKVPSAYLKYSDVERLANRIRELAEIGADGVVVTQGTDTIEETAFILDRIIDNKMPIVVTGAMRNPSSIGADGAANLFAAVRVVDSQKTRRHGCVVVLNDEIHAARFVRKMHTNRTDAFMSPLAGRIGWVSERKVRVVLRPPKIPVLLSQEKALKDARVGLLKVALGDDDELVRVEMGARFDGLVLEAMGGGHINSEMADVLQEIAEKIPIILTSRTGVGEVLTETYGFLGGEIDLKRRGVISGGWLDAIKSKVMLTLLLRGGVCENADIRAAFAPWGGG